MWMFTKIGFVSVVKDAGAPQNVWLRFRCLQDAERFRAFSVEAAVARPATVMSTPESDYPYRMRLHRVDWLELAAALAGDVDYPNFKQAALEDDTCPSRWQAYHEVWGIMRQFQHRRTDGGAATSPVPCGGEEAGRHG